MHASLRALAALVSVVATSRSFALCPLDPSTAPPDDLTCYVSKTGNDANPGTSGSPMLTIQAALDRVAAGTTTVVQTVRVLPGTYQECPGLGTDGLELPGVPGDVDVVADDFLTRSVNTTTIVDPTGITFCDTRPAVELGDNSSLIGFTIKGGKNSGVAGYGHVRIANNVIIDNVSLSVGGGVFLHTGANVRAIRAETRVENNSILNNTAPFDGGGIYAYADGNGLPTQVVITSNTISDNTSGEGNTDYPIFGGGVTVFSDSRFDTDRSTVTITNNTIEGNEAKGVDVYYASYGGGLFVATFGAGAETIDIKSTNVFRNNKATQGYGGGIAALGQALFPGAIDHSVLIEGNSITGNTAEFGGGGVYALTQPLTITAVDALEIQVRANEIAGNAVTGAADQPGVTGGGGIFGEFFNEQTVGDNKSLIVSGNALRNNTSQSFGGGAALWVRTFGEPDSKTSQPGRLPASSRLRFVNNLVTGNTAVDTQSGDSLGEGGGVYLRTFGQAGGVSAIDFKFNTVADNIADTGLAGGVAIVSSNIGGPSPGGIGSSTIDVSNSIIVSNSGFAVGGSAIPGVENTTVRIAYNDTFDNGAEPFAPQYLATAGPGNLTVDPEVDAFFVPLLCSPTIDAADPAEGTRVGGELQDERQPNAGRANLGHTGLTLNAAVTLPDATGDGLVDGVDILRVATSFASSSSQVGRYNEAADADRDGDIDGNDLSFTSAWFGKACP